MSVIHVLELSPEQQSLLDTNRAAAVVRHEKERKAALQRGRVDFPLLPYECSWAYEEEIRRGLHKPQPRRFPWLS